MRDEILGKVCRAIDALIEAGDKYEGLFPSLLDIDTLEMPAVLPEPIKGQRKGDRSYPGSNLIHDEPTLLTMYGLAEALGRPDYAAAADRYLNRFANHCTGTVNGLFPWGEHAYWDLIEDRLNPDAIHDHLRQAPVWLWDKLYQFNPKCVETFAEGLDYHWTDTDPVEYCRHAPMEEKKHAENGSRSCDFPRHGGFYILDWSYAYLRTGRKDFLEQIRKMIDYWWTCREPGKPLFLEKRSPEHALQLFQVYTPGQTLSLGVSMLESADLLEAKEPELAAEMRMRGRVYADSFVESPHDPEKGIYYLAFKPGVDEATSISPIWGSIYGVWPASYMALIALCAYRMLGDARLLRYAESVGRGYLTAPMPGDVAVPAMDAGLALGLLADLYDITGERNWIDSAQDFAQKLCIVYLHRDLPCGAAGIDWYESQMGPGFLLHGLARVALMSEDPKGCTLRADYTAR